MKSFKEWREEKALQENTFALGVASPQALGVANAQTSIEEGKKKKMFGDELADDGGELAKASEPKDADVDVDDDGDDDADSMCGKKDLTPSMMKKCGKSMKKKMAKEGCGDDMEDEADDDDDDDMGEEEGGEMTPMMMKKKQKKKSKKESYSPEKSYNPNETPAEFLASIASQLRGSQKSNHDGISEYLEDSLIPSEEAPESGEVGTSPFTRIGELGGNFDSNEWKEIRELAIGGQFEEESVE